MSDFPAYQDSEILVRGRARGIKLESAYKRRKGIITKETPQTILLKELKKRGITTFSKRDVARAQGAEEHHGEHQQFSKATTSKKQPQPIKSKQPRKKTLQEQLQRLAIWEHMIKEE